MKLKQDNLVMAMAMAYICIAILIKEEQMSANLMCTISLTGAIYAISDLVSNFFRKDYEFNSFEILTSDGKLEMLYKINNEIYQMHIFEENNTNKTVDVITLCLEMSATIMLIVFAIIPIEYVNNNLFANKATIFSLAIIFLSMYLNRIKQRERYNQIKFINNLVLNEISNCKMGYKRINIDEIIKEEQQDNC